ncbi:MAG: VanZ family protein [Candidatus Schekmanbacteria bacterium]|nr:VanZ family protein [Candidatus Schekmanbacteria bacterium]
MTHRPDPLDSDSARGGAAAKNPAIPRWALFAGYAVTIVALSSRPLPGGVDLPPDKLLHAIEYAVFALLLARGMAVAGRPWTWHRALLVLAVTTAFAITDEIHQAFVPLRDASGADMLADVTGAALALGALAFTPFRRLVLGPWRRAAKASRCHALPPPTPPSTRP